MCVRVCARAWWRVLVLVLWRGEREERGEGVEVEENDDHDERTRLNAHVGADTRLCKDSWPSDSLSSPLGSGRLSPEHCHQPAALSARISFVSGAGVALEWKARNDDQIAVYLKHVSHV